MLVDVLRNSQFTMNIRVPPPLCHCISVIIIVLWQNATLVLSECMALYLQLLTLAVFTVVIIIV